MKEIMEVEIDTHPGYGKSERSITTTVTNGNAETAAIAPWGTMCYGAEHRLWNHR